MGLDGNIIERRLLEGVLAPSITRKNSEVSIDNKSIIRDAEGKLRTAVGGADLGSDSIEWDGSTEGLVSFSYSGVYTYYKVSDKIPDLTSASDLYITYRYTEEGEADAGPIKSDANINEGLNTEFVTALRTDFLDGFPLVLVALSDNTEYPVFETTIPEKGVYFVGVSVNGISLFAQKLDIVCVEKINSKFLDLKEVYTTIDNVPKVTRTSQLTNDSGFLTLDTLPKYGGETE